MDDFSPAVGSAAKGWRSYADLLSSWRKHAKSDPEGTAASLLATMRSSLQTYGDRMRYLLAHPRRDDEEWRSELRIAIALHALWTTAEAGARYAVDEAAEAGEPPARRIVDHVVAALDNAPVGAAVLARDWPDEAERGEAAVVLGGYVRSRWDLSKNRRLADARIAVGGEGEMASRIPAAALLAWAERRADDEPLAAFVTRTAGLLEGERDRDARMPEGMLEGLEDFEAREQAHIDVRERAVRAGLSTREGEVFERLLQGATETEIAADLAIAVGTVRSHKARVFRKIRAA